MKYLLILFVICVSFVGCNSMSSESFEIDDYDELVLTSNNIDYGDLTYKMETDSQNYFPYDYRNYTATQDGYYTFWNDTICFIERDTLKCLPVCSKPECSHNNSDCDAYIDDIAPMVYYYKDNLYSVIYETEASDNSDATLRTYSLYKISTDGSIREKTFEIYSSYDNSFNYPMFIIHRDYIYYTYGDKEFIYLVRRNLDGSASETIYKADISTKIIGKLNGYGEGVMFVVSDIANPYDSKILYYSCNTGQLYNIIENVSGMLVVTDDSIICNDQNDILKVDIHSLKKEIFVKNAGGHILMSYDGRYIYVDNLIECYDFSAEGKDDFTKRRIDIYDTKGMLVDVINLEGIDTWPDFGDETYLFLSYYDKDDYKRYAFDKTQIATANHEWKEIILN